VNTFTLTSQPSAPPVSVGKLWLDPGSRRASIGDKPLDLTSTEYDILLALARSAGRVKSREQLLLEVADRDFEAFDRSIDVHISSLRRKLGDDPRSPRFVQTIRGVGYLLSKPGSEIPE
jgi:DNA-binding response OmpR family regulator